MTTIIVRSRLAEVELELAESSIWDNPEYAQKLGRERAALEIVVMTIEALDSGLGDVADIVELAGEENDESLFNEGLSDHEELESRLGVLEFNRMFSGEMDGNSAFPGYPGRLRRYRGPGLG